VKEAETNLEHAEKSGLAGIVETKEADLGLLVPEA
jgi:hypothetical protein